MRGTVAAGCVVFSLVFAWAAGVGAEEAVEEVLPGRDGWRLELGTGADFAGRGDGLWLGGHLSGAVVGWDRLAFVGRFGLLRSVGSPATQGVLTRSATRATLELEAQYRYAVPLASGDLMHVLVGLGAAASYETVEETRLHIGPQVDPDCDPSAGPCPARTSVETDRHDSLSLRPQVTFGVRFGPAAITYTLRLNLEDLAASEHILRLGFAY